MDLAARLGALPREALLAVDPRTRVIVHADGELNRLLGPAEWAGRDWSCLPATIDDPAWLTLDVALDDGDGFVGQVRLRRADGEALAVELRGRPLDADPPLYLLAIRPADRLPPPPAETAAALVPALLYRLIVAEDGRLAPVWFGGDASGLCGYDADELLARGGTASLVASEDRRQLRRRNQLVLRGAAAEVDYHLRGRDDRLVPVRDRAAPVFDRRGELVIAVSGALTERPAVALPTSEPNDDARALFDALAVPALRLDPAGRIVAVNPSLARLLTTGADQFAGAPLGLLIADAGQRAEVDADLAGLHAGAPLADRTVVLRAGDGRFLRLRLRLAALEGGATLVQALPVAGDDEATDAARLRAVVDNMADGVLAVGPSGLVEWVSRSAETIFELGPGEAMGRPIDRIVLGAPEGGPAGVALLARLAETPGEPHELLGRLKGGEAVPIEVAVNGYSEAGRRTFVLTVRDITLRKQTEETLRNLAYHDPLTGLPNRLLFNDRLTQAIERAKRQRHGLAVLLVDLDRFKLINDSLGLDLGDRVLRLVGERLVTALRSSDTVARLAADEFLVLLPGTAEAEHAARVAQKLLEALKPALQIDGNGQDLAVTASIGIAIYPHDGDGAETLIRNADTALSRAKEQGRNAYQFYTTDMNATAFERLVLEGQLRRALARGEFVLHFQPQIRVGNGAVVGVEALVRWVHPQLGLVPPAEFIPVAEDTGLIVPIGEWVLRSACAEVRALHDRGRAGLRLAVNLSARQFRRDDLVERIGLILEETRFPAERLDLELTESTLMQDAESAAVKLHALAERGIRLSIDDFGTGYSSLGYLKRFPIQTLKIDRSFITDIPTDPNDSAIAEAILALAGSLGVQVIAEGVETVAQLEFLRALGCEEMQGYLFSPPLTAVALEEFLRTRNTPAEF